MVVQNLAFVNRRSIIIVAAQIFGQKFTAANIPLGVDRHPELGLGLDYRFSFGNSICPFHRTEAHYDATQDHFPRK